VGEEALAIAVYAALAGRDDVPRALRVAVNHSGDSDSTGSIAASCSAPSGHRRGARRVARGVELADVLARRPTPRREWAGG
jgi:ADP-ribosylglycohydrolase